MKNKTKMAEENISIERLVKFMKKNGEREAILGLRLDEHGKLEVDCSIGEDDTEDNPSCVYGDSVPKVVSESIAAYKKNKEYFDREKAKLKAFHDKHGKRL